ncbi:MAG: hypothetical protein JKX98_04420 [Alcanivoracaceae bacterium]|nr:hypothetical protein [Alcanivoracaceae bacterium]
MSIQAQDSITKTDEKIILQTVGRVLPEEIIEVFNREEGVITWVSESGNLIESGQLILSMYNEKLHFQLKQKELEIEQFRSEKEYKIVFLNSIKQAVASKSVSINELNKLANEINIIQLEIQKLTLEQQEIQVRINSMFVTAIHDGTVGDRYFSTGQFLKEGKLVVKFIENKYALEIKVPFKSVSKEPSLKNFAFEIDSRFGAIITEDYFIIPNTNNLLATIIFRVKLPDYEWINGENIRVDIISK